MIHLLTFASRPQAHHADKYIRDFAAEAENLKNYAKRWGWEWEYRDEAWMEALPNWDNLKGSFAGPFYGYFLFKPFLIWNMLDRLKDGEILVWSDTANVFYREPREIIAWTEVHEIWTHDHSRGTPIYPEKDWCKRDAFVLMDMDYPEAWYHPQMRVDLMAFKAGPFCRKLAKEWLDYALDHRIISDDPNVMGKPNLPDFKEHRREQAIMSLLTCRHNLPNAEDPQFKLYEKTVCVVTPESRVWKSIR